MKSDTSQAARRGGVQLLQILVHWSFTNLPFCNAAIIFKVNNPVLAGSLSLICNNITCRGTVHYGDVTMGSIASQITSLTIVYSTVYSGADQRKHQSSVSLAFVRGIHRGPVNSPHKWPVTRKMFPFDDVIMRIPLPYLLQHNLSWDSRSCCTLWQTHCVSRILSWFGNADLFIL